MVAVVLSSGIGWVAGSKIKSPAEVAARTAPPVASPILVPAENRVLSTDVVTRGTARFGSPQQVSIAPSALKSTVPVITSVPNLGTELSEGDLILSASGRPVFLLTGATPSYRDLGPGLRGDDIAQLEAALSRLGFDPGPVDGVYDGATEIAVSAMYEAAGFAAFSTTPEQAAAIRALESEVASARSDAVAKRDSLSSARAGLAAARAEFAGAWAAVLDGQTAMGVAFSEARVADLSAKVEVATTREHLEALLSDLSTPVADVAAARSGLEIATLRAEATSVAGQAQVQAANSSSSVAKSRLESAIASVDDAASALGSAQEILQIDGSLTSAEPDLVRARDRAGVQVPADEIVFISSTPVRVSSVSAAPGSDAAGQVMEVTDSNIAIDSSLPLEEAPLVSVGMVVNIDEVDLGISVTGTVSRVADGPGTNGVDGFHVYIEIAVDGSPVGVVGSSLRLKIPIQSTGGSVLAVPISALSLAADGSSRVQHDVGGSLVYTAVEAGLSADGFVAITTADGSLKAGDLVVVGFDRPAASGG